jgi:hypothetical protein
LTVNMINSYGRAAVAFVGGGHGQETMGEHGQGDPAAGLVLIQPGDIPARKDSSMRQRCPATPTRALSVTCYGL